MDFLTIVFRTVIFYFLVLILYRIMGKREIGQLSIIDLIISILIAELVAISIENYNDSILNSLVPVIVLVLLQILLANITMFFPKMRLFFDGKPSTIIKRGKINFKEMSRQKYNLDDLLMQLREKGIKSIEEIDYAILENTGKLSIFRKTTDNIPPYPLIVEGVINYSVLKDIKKDTNWVNNILKRKNLKLDDIFYAFYNKDKTYIIKKQ